MTGTCLVSIQLKKYFAQWIYIPAKVNHRFSCHLYHRLLTRLKDILQIQTSRIKFQCSVSLCFLRNWNQNNMFVILMRKLLNSIMIVFINTHFWHTLIYQCKNIHFQFLRHYNWCYLYIILMTQFVWSARKFTPFSFSVQQVLNSNFPHKGS